MSSRLHYSYKAYIVWNTPKCCLYLGLLYSDLRFFSFLIAYQSYLQLVEIFMHCAEKKVYHVDSHFNNILINPKTGEIKLIDFNQVAIAEDIHMKARKFAGLCC